MKRTSPSRTRQFGLFSRWPVFGAASVIFLLTLLGFLIGDSLVVSAEDLAVPISRTATNLPPMETRIFHVDPDSFKPLLDGISGSSTPASFTNQLAEIERFLAASGIDLQITNALPSANFRFMWSDKHGLMVHATLQELKKVETAIENLNASTAQRTRLAAMHFAEKVRDKFNDSTNPATAQPQSAPRANTLPRRDLMHTTTGRRNIVTKLESIQIDSVKFDGLPLEEVIRNLAELSSLRDADGAGINFLFDRQTTGIANGDPAVTDTSAASVRITINPALTHLRLQDVLSAIVQSADRPIRYSIRDYAVVFSLKDPNEPPGEMRVFHADPNTFRQGLEGVAAIPFGSSSNSVSGQSSPSVPQVNVTGGVSGVSSNSK